MKWSGGHAEMMRVQCLSSAAESFRVGWIQGAKRAEALSSAERLPDAFMA
jgi:hypothetical protein